jgi:hypothetical protein
MNLPSCQIFSVFGMGIGWLRARKIFKNGYDGRVEQGERGVNLSGGDCAELGCSKLDGEKVRGSNTAGTEKSGGHRGSARDPCLGQAGFGRSRTKAPASVRKITRSRQDDDAHRIVTKRRLLFAQSDQRIYASGAPSWDVAGQERHGRQQRGDGREHDGIRRCHVEEQGSEEAS